MRMTVSTTDSGKRQCVTVTRRQTDTVKKNGGLRSECIKKRVAAYCRVSTDHEAQLESLDNQMAAFRFKIQQHEDWALSEIYVDEGLTGTSVKKRTGFQKMIDACRDGQIDYIITKSISRFARNTLDCIKYIRELQKLGIYVLFEKENIDTGEVASEMLLVIMAAFAQEESRSISENVKWGMRKRFAAGAEMPVPIYGYRHNEKGMYQIVPHEAQIVKEIFTRYVDGESMSAIMNDMIRRGEPAPFGKNWKILQLRRMLHNEKYVGDVTLQKNYVVDHITHEEVKNDGTVPMYHISNAHAAIIDRRLYDQAQQITAMHDRKNGNESYPYGTKLKCPCCGRILMHGNLYGLLYMYGKIVHGGGWGCYGEGGCRKYLIPQVMLDAAIINGYERKYHFQYEKVEFGWLDNNIDQIVLKDDNSVELHWHDREVSIERFEIPNERMEPFNCAVKYNQYLSRVRRGETKDKAKFRMGL